VHVRNNFVEVKETLHLLLPKDTTIQDAINEIKKVEGLSENSSLRIMEIHGGRIWKDFPLNLLLSQISDTQSQSLYAEEILFDELFAHDLLKVQVVHFYQSSQIHYFGDPFYLFLQQEDTIDSIKEKIFKKLCSLKEDCTKWKLALLIPFKSPLYPTKSENIGSLISKDIDECCLGLEHFPAVLRRDKGITIKG